MTLTLVDWLVIGAYFAFNIIIGLVYRKLATKSTDEYFAGGRNVSWWLAGTSMVATTFAADTPLAVTGLVASYGIAGNWLWWSMCLSNMLTVFFFARLWRRAGVLTDVEFAEFRYGGKPAAFLRIFRALYLGLPINCIILGWVNLAMVKILLVIFPITKVEALWVVFGMMFITAGISTLSGLWGVLVTDAFQFVLKMGMVIVLAVFAVRASGGMESMLSKVVANSGNPSVLSFLPEIGSAWMPPIAFFMMLAVNWWATWYPGSEPGGGGYVAQRMFCAKDEKNSLLATLWFTVAHYAIRPWPWILTALASLALYPALKDKESGFIQTLADPAVLPPALRGLMLAAFAAAYMSTIATQLNWGASYLVNDVYRRFLAPNRSEKTYVRVSQIATLLLMVSSIGVTYYQDSISGAWKFLIAVGAGTGSVLILRWFWWRINAWSEIVAMITSFLVSIFASSFLGLRSDRPDEFAWSVMITVIISTIAWLVATYLSAPESQERLLAFYRRVQPHPGGWGPIARLAANEGIHPPLDFWSNFSAWILGSSMTYGVLFGIGKLLFGETVLGLALLALAGACGFLLYQKLNARGWKVIN